MDDSRDDAAARDPQGAGDDPLPPRFLFLLALLTLGGWGLLGLGVHALAQAALHWRPVYLAAAVMPLLLGGALSLSTARAWRAMLQRWRQQRR